MTDIQISITEYDKISLICQHGTKTNNTLAHMDMHTQDKHIHSKGIPLEGCCVHGVYCSPQLLISCFPSVMRGHPLMIGEKGMLIKIAAGLVFPNQTALHWPQAPSWTRRLLFLPQSPLLLPHIPLAHWHSLLLVSFILMPSRCPFLSLT